MPQEQADFKNVQYVVPFMKDRGVTDRAAAFLATHNQKQHNLCRHLQGFWSAERETDRERERKGERDGGREGT